MTVESFDLMKYNIAQDIKAIYNNEHDRGLINPELSKHKSRMRLFEDISCVANFVFDCFLKYSQKYNLDIDSKLIELETKYVSLNIIEPYLLDNRLFQLKKHQLNKFINEYIADKYLTNSPQFLEFESVVKYFHQLTQDISA